MSDTHGLRALDALHPLKGNHPLEQPAVMRHVLRRVSGLFEGVPPGPMCLYFMNGPVPDMAYSKKRPPSLQHLAAVTLLRRIDRLVRPHTGGHWLVALGNWEDPPAFLIGAQGTYDMVLAAWMDGSGDIPYVVARSDLIVEGMPDPDYFAESCANAHAVYGARLADLEIGKGMMTNKAASSDDWWAQFGSRGSE